ncbi:MAG: hypothetical protein FJ308_09860 [Planctomycetes bacterium]|nr:hypothetical protein [Planctomycetota bacterium]
MRILSLLPAATDMLTAMGLTHFLVGCTHECDIANRNAAIPRVTRSKIPCGSSSDEIDRMVRDACLTKEPLTWIDRELVCSLRPDVVVSQGLCEVCALTPNQLQELALDLDRTRAEETPIRWIEIAPTTLEEVFHSMHVLGAAIGQTDAAVSMIQNLRNRMAILEERHRGMLSISTVTLEWLQPFFNVGHWTPELLRTINLVDRLSVPRGHSHPCSWSEIVAAQPEVILFACCGRTREETHREIESLSSTIPWLDLRAMANGRFLVLDGNTSFSRPGPRLVETLEEISWWLTNS